jgi:hypothetical protein
MPNKEQIRDIVMLYIAWTGESKIINTEDIDSAVDFIIDSMQEEPINEDLEEELSAYVNSEEYLNNIGTSGLLLIARHFADWQKQQMMAKAVDGHVGQTINGMLRALSDETFGDMGFTAGDKVKLIIIKQE